jgi:hypothetical protein
MLLSAVSVLVVAQPSSEVPEGLTDYPIYINSERRKIKNKRIKSKLIIRLRQQHNHSFLPAACALRCTAASCHKLSTNNTIHVSVALLIWNTDNSCIVIFADMSNVSHTHRAHARCVLLQTVRNYNIKHSSRDKQPSNSGVPSYLKPLICMPGL